MLHLSGTALVLGELGELKEEELEMPSLANRLTMKCRTWRFSPGSRQFNPPELKKTVSKNWLSKFLHRVPEVGLVDV